MRRTSTCCALLALTLTLPMAVAAQEEARTFFAAQYEHTLIDSELPDWTDWKIVRALAYRDFDGGSLGVELVRTDRFSLVDESATVDAYANLWNGSYVNLQVRGTSDADVLPDWSARAELFQVFGGAWEASATAWRMGFASGDVDIVGGALARYEGNWYLRGRALMSWNAGESAPAFAVSARRILSTRREFVEVSAGTGEEVVVLGAGPVVDLRRTSFVQGVGQQFLTRRLGLSFHASYTTFEDAPSRLALGIGLMTRFGAGR